MAYDGAYYLQHENLIRTGIHQHSSSLPRPFSDETLSAINTIQATPWAINTFILDLMRECWVSGDLLGGLPSPYDVALPAEIDDSVWDQMTEEARKEHKQRRADVHATNARAVSTRAAFLTKLSVAEELRDRPAIWFPHFCDFRGRFYPANSDITPQGDDISKSLLQFSTGKRLGHRGIYWLAVRLANTFGLDKLPLDERVAWAWDHTKQIRDSAERPLEGERFWTEAEEPWQFLATCREWTALHDQGETYFESHLPINLDGTANGLQHLSALGRDPVGALATNMTADPQRHDIYSLIAKPVEDMVRDDALSGNMIASWWTGRINRSVVKRAVMTTPYGVTDHGIRDQLVQDGFTKDLAKRDRGPHADYLRDKIVLALGSTVSSAKDIMAYLQGVALAVTEAGKPLQWITPTGNVVQQSYYNLARKELKTMSGTFILWDENPLSGLSTKKNTLAAAPNYIHSLDASHAAKTVNRLTTEIENVSLAMIHDSYGTHACDIDLMNRAIREEFVTMHEHDLLAEFEEYVHAYAPDVKFPNRPERKDFDIREVLKAEYFFA